MKVVLIERPKFISFFLRKLYKIKKLSECTCETFEYKERRIKRCNININNLETRVLNAVNSKDIDKIENI